VEGKQADCAQAELGRLKRVWVHDKVLSMHSCCKAAHPVKAR
jgi:hypothetical protein